MKLLITLLLFCSIANASVSFPKFSLKKGVSVNDIRFIDPRLLLLMSFVSHWCNERNITLLITSIHRKDNDEISDTRVHQEWRAFDFSIRGFKQYQIIELVQVINQNFRFIGAISKASGLPTPIVIHKDKNGIVHGHIQVNKIKEEIL